MSSPRRGPTAKQRASLIQAMYRATSDFHANEEVEQKVADTNGSRVPPEQVYGEGRSDDGFARAVFTPSASGKKSA
jgi:hypothetical protein